MELGQRIKNARLEAGLSQRQLCGNVITRNMLSLIENGNARPSMDTLCYLASELGKPVGYFLEEEQSVSSNQLLILAARVADPAQALELLKTYQTPDAVFDPEYYLLTALSYLALAEEAIRDNRLPLAVRHLDRAAQAGAATNYYTPDLERRHLLLYHRTKVTSAANLAEKLPDNTPELMLRALAALETGDLIRCAACLDAAVTRDAAWYFLRGEVFFEEKKYQKAIGCYLEAETYAPERVYSRLETCYKELEDFKQAYFYACKQR